MVFMTLKFKELEAMGKAELTEKIVELKQELAKERSTIASGTRSENPGKIKKLRRDIARLFTVIEMKRSE